MAVSKIDKFKLVALQSDKDKVVDLLHTQGVAQIIEAGSGDRILASDENSPEYLYAQVNFAINFLKKYDETKVPLKDILMGDKIELTEGKMDSVLSSFDFKKVVADCETLEAKVNELNSKTDRNKADSAILKVWSKLDFIPEAEIDTSRTKTLLGSVATKDFDEVVVGLEKLLLVNIEKVESNDSETHLSITFFNEKEAGVKAILTKADFKLAQLPEIDVPVVEFIKRAEEENKEAERELQNLLIDVRTQVGNLEKLRIVFDTLAWKKEQKEVTGKASTTEKTFALSFWMEEKSVKNLKKSLDAMTSNYILDTVEPEKDEKKPVALTNSKSMEAFEMVTGIYGMPLANEPDPTPFLAGFFVIFFGMCLTDAGYGLVLALLSFLALKFFKVPRETAKLFKVLIWGGFATFILGALFGGWFGIIIDEQLPSIIARPLQAIRIIDPVKNPITILIVTLIMGVIQLLTGVLISMWWKIKNGKLVDGLLDDGLWFYFISSIVFWVTTKVGVVPASLGSFALVLVLIGVVAMLLTQGRKEKSILGKVIGGVGSLYGLVGYFSDTLSYSRLLALGLATGIIAMVINMIGLLVADMIPYVGWILAIFIIIGGHIFNMVINVLGSFIHSSRLQFVEFFAKFMEGGGSRFKPFRKQSKYIRLVK